MKVVARSPAPAATTTEPTLTSVALPSALPSLYVVEPLTWDCPARSIARLDREGVGADGRHGPGEIGVGTAIAVTVYVPSSLRSGAGRSVADLEVADRGRLAALGDLGIGADRDRPGPAVVRAQVERGAVDLRDRDRPAGEPGGSARSTRKDPRPSGTALAASAAAGRPCRAAGWRTRSLQAGPPAGAGRRRGRRPRSARARGTQMRRSRSGRIRSGGGSGALRAGSRARGAPGDVASTLAAG